MYEDYIEKYKDITEVSGDYVTQEQIERLYNRYYWAGKYCRGKDVLEVACGTGQGLGYLANISNEFYGGDYSKKNLEIAQLHYGNRIVLSQFSAEEIPYGDNSLDVIVFLEALYFIPSAEKFVTECKRILKKNGRILIATANKDLYDFNIGPYSYKYYGVIELNELFSKYGFEIELFGNTPTNKLSFRQKVFRPIKKIAITFGLIPKSMKGKKFLKRIVFGHLIKMPSEIYEGMISYNEPTRISLQEPDRIHKVIYCVATLKNNK